MVRTRISRSPIRDRSSHSGQKGRVSHNSCPTAVLSTLPFPRTISTVKQRARSSREMPLIRAPRRRSTRPSREKYISQVRSGTVTRQVHEGTPKNRGSAPRKDAPRGIRP